MPERNPMEDYWWARTGWRLALLATCVAVALGLVVLRHLQLVLAPPDQVARQIQLRSGPTGPEQLPSYRGSLMDRDGYPLAVSTPVETLALDVQVFRDQPEVWGQIERIADLDSSVARGRFLNPNGRRLIFLKRQLDPGVSEQLRSLRLPGLHLVREFRRYYPAGEVLAPVIGLTDIDSDGLEGLEAVFDDWLQSGQDGRVAREDGAGVAEKTVFSLPAEGRDLQLTLDIDLQYWAYRALKETIVSSGARSGSLVAVDVPTGDILAIASYPSYNPNNRRTLKVQRNRAAMDRIEPGSIMKPFTVAAALQTGDWDSSSQVDTSPGYINLPDGTRFADTRNLGSLGLKDILVRSSQVGAVRLALAMEPDQLPALLRDLGFGSLTGIGLPGEAAGYVPAAERMRTVRQATLGFGYGCSVTLLQLAQAYSVLGNRGLLQPLRLVKGLSGPEPRQVMPVAVADQVLAMLEQVVQHGTGRRAALPGYRVAGKTGTVHIVGKQGYELDRYRALFAGLAPASKPRIALVAMVEEPNPNYYFGGQVVAPLFARVVQQILLHLAVPPDGGGTG